MLRTRSVVRWSLVVSSLVVGGLAGPAPGHAAPKDWTLPADAKALGDDVYEIYSHDDADGRVRFCWAIVSRQHGAEARAAAGGSRGGSGGAPYTFIDGMKWKGAPKGYYVDASGAVGHTDGTLSDQNVRDAIRDAIAQWEDATNGVLGDGVSLDVMGDELGTSVDAASIGVAANGRNEICFGPIATAGIVAITYVYGTSNGPTSRRQIDEADQLYNNRERWTGTGGALYLDFANAAQHECGHAFGMGHCGSAYTEETMFSGIAPGETKKRSLGAGDIAGIDNLY
jgi:hypothetical protein